MKNFFILIAVVLFAALPVFSQHPTQSPLPPVSVELMFGNNKSAALMGMNKQIVGPLRYNSITSVASTYDHNKGKPELIMINSFLYQMHRNFAAGAGLQYHFLKGLVPSISLNAGYADSVWLISVMPFLNLKPDTNSENVVILEFKPQLSETLKLYTRALALYNHNITLKEHDRSFYYFRLGLTLNKFTVGGAVNMDYYGPVKINQNNYGGFLTINI